MGKFEQSAMVAVCGVLEEIVMAERVRSSTASGGEREKIGRKEKRVGPVTGINWDPQELSSDLNPAWIKKHVKG